MILSNTSILPIASMTLTLVLVLVPPALAVERDLGIHEHGAATLDVALDGAWLYLDLDSPADNLLGFEHAPSSDAQRETLEKVRRVLESGELFAPDADAGCALESADVDIVFGGDHLDAHPDEERDDTEHGEPSRQRERHASERDEHADERRAAQGHSDITAGYLFVCEDPAALERISTALFERFDGFADIAVQLVGPGGQDGMTLTPDDTDIVLDAIR